ncbi:MAG: transcription termination/antitermination factor NusG [Candidatus Lambdaproteobacteria bacterium]|nr:transcription termination/antitermination factor NusG [Candidatus Lambdaproteobacteria bacterium]
MAEQTQPEQRPAEDQAPEAAPVAAPDVASVAALDVAPAAATQPGPEPVATQPAAAEPSPYGPDYKWYILQTYSGFEHRVERTINEKLKISQLVPLVEEVFVPGEDVTRVKNGKKRKTHVIYFPGYVLIKMKLTDELWHLLMGIPRVSGFVGGTRKEPQPLEDSELGMIRHQMTQGVRQQAMREEFGVGQQVVVIDGPFANFTGKIDEVNNEKNKLRVLISILGRSTPVELDFDKVKAYTPEG